jgi:hypothetical protein
MFAFQSLLIKSPRDEIGCFYLVDAAPVRDHGQ